MCFQAETGVLLRCFLRKTIKKNGHCLYLKIMNK